MCIDISLYIFMPYIAISFLTSIEQHMQEKMADIGNERANKWLGIFFFICNANCSIVFHLRMAGDIGEQIKKYEDLYEKLMNAQQELGLGTTAPDRLADN